MPQDDRAAAHPSDPDLGVGEKRVFRAETIREALADVRSAIGGDAIILSTRDLKTAGTARFEVIAAFPAGRAAMAGMGPTYAPRQRPPTLSFDAPLATGHPSNARWPATGDVTDVRFGGQGGPGETLRGNLGVSARSSQRTAQQNTGPTAELNARMVADRVASLHGSIAALAAQVQAMAESNEGLREELTRQGRLLGAQAPAPEAAKSEEVEGASPLVEAGIDADVAARLMLRAIRRAAPASGLAVAEPPDIASELERALQVTTPIWRLPPGSVCALIGPAGQGKTTTLLKLAGLAAFAHGRTVACISTDVQRIGPYAALRAYQEVMGFPLVAARDRAELDAALERFADADLVLIDTPGHNPFDDNQRERAISCVGGREVSHHLVVSATQPFSHLMNIISRYDGPALESLIFTRCDEASSLATAVSASLATEVPVSHLASGQEVPDDIRTPDRKRIASAILTRAS